MSEAQAVLAALRRQGAWRLDPARFHALEALARRLPTQPEPVRRVLQERLQAAVAAYAERFAQAPAAEPPRPVAVRADAARCAPLAQLNQYIRAASTAGAAPAELEPQEQDELASARRFRRAWSASRSAQQVEQAASRRPANAGPLNSHALVLQSLALARSLSPDYLRRLLVQVESLQWLERARELYPSPAKQADAGKAAKSRSRGKKSGSR